MKPRTITFDDLSGGIDRSGGVIVRDARRFYDQLNTVTTPNGSIAMRPPLREEAGEFDADTAGAAYINGRFVTIGDEAGTHTIAGAETLVMDLPEFSGAWELVKIVTLNETICALVKHSFPNSVLCPHRTFLHVFDGKHPTYSTDPAVPTFWSPAFPMQAFGPGTRGAYREYDPLLSVVNERIAITTPDGNVALSAVGLPRVFNTRSAADILANGEMFYAILDTTAGTQYFTAPVPYEDLVTDQRYAAYVVERLEADGTWVQFTEVSAISSINQCQIIPYANRFDAAAPDETRVLIRPATAADGMVVRLRVLARPSVSIVSGLYVATRAADDVPTQNAGHIVGGILSHEGRSHSLTSVDLPSVAEVTSQAHISVVVPGAPIDIPVVANGESNTYTLNGQQRYWSRIVAQVSTLDITNPRTGEVRVLYDGTDFAIFAKSGDLDKTGIIVGDTVRVGASDFTVTTVNWAKNAAALHVTAVGTPTISLASATTGTGGTVPTGGSYYSWSDVGFNGDYRYTIEGTTTIAVGGTVLQGSGTKYTRDLVVGREIEINSEKRKVVAITSDIRAEVELPFSSAGSYFALRDPRYDYAATVGETGNEWYATLEADVAANKAGQDDALLLGTANYDNGGGSPVAVAQMQDRMLVQYPAVVQLWAVPASVAGVALLSTLGDGAGQTVAAEPVMVDSFAGLPTVNGPKLFSPRGDEKNYIDSVSVGDKLRGIALPAFDRSIFWPHQRVWVMAASSGDNGRMFVLSYHRERKVMAWSTWQTSITTIDAFTLRGNQLVVSSGRKLYYFDPDETSFIDYDATQIEARARFLYNTLNRPEANKRLVRVDLMQTGKASLRVYPNPARPDAVVAVGTFTGPTIGMPKNPVMANGPAFGLEVVSSDPAGYALDAVSFDYILLNR